MRIISGVLKGRRITPPKKLPVRPTTDRAKESLFNILIHQYEFEGCAVLDLFSGTGSIAYEFASRGVSTIVAVDQNAACAHFVSQTSATLQLPITVVKMPVAKFLSQNTNAYDFVFADPPYAFSVEDYTEIVASVFSKNMLKQEGICIIEHAEQIDLSELPYFSTSRNYGGCVFSFFEW